MLLSKGKIFSAMAGLAMLALPVSAFAGHRPDNRFAARPFIAHDRGFHNGWFKPAAPVQFARPIYRQPVREFLPAARPIGWNNEWREEEEEEHEWHPVASPGYRCDADGDDCEGPYYYRPQYQPSYEVEDEDENENYGGQPYSWYMQPAPIGYNLLQRRAWLITRRHRAMFVIAALRARGDSRAAGRLANAVNALTAQINAIDRQMYGYNGGYGYAPSNFGAPANPLLGALVGNPGYYGATNSNPTLNVLSALVGPMLGIQ